MFELLAQWYSGFLSNISGGDVFFFSLSTSEQLVLCEHHENLLPIASL
jgi:hypothetical protein